MSDQGFDEYASNGASNMLDGLGNDSVELTDTELIALAKTDKEAFGELYQRYVERIYNYIYYRTHSKEDAEDLTAKVFQRALIHIPKYEDKGYPFSAWLYRIARNLVLNWHRDTGRRTIIALDDIVNTHEGEGSPEGLVQLVQNEESLLKVVRQLPPDRQELLILKFLHRMPNAEIGEIMGRSEGAVKSLYHRTLLVLRDQLTADAETEGLLDDFISDRAGDDSPDEKRKSSVRRFFGRRRGDSE